METPQHVFGESDVEVNIKYNYRVLEKGFQDLSKMDDEMLKLTLLKELTNIMQESKRLIKDFERESRSDGMPPKVIAEKKRELVQALNRFISTKKSIATELSTLTMSTEHLTTRTYEDKGTDELILLGRDQIRSTEESLENSRQVVEATLQIGAQAASTLGDQSKQMEGILHDLDDITFNMRKAQDVIAEITRSFVTDRCILTLCCIIMAIIMFSVIVATLVMQPISSDEPPAPTPTPTPATLGAAADVPSNGEVPLPLPLPLPLPSPDPTQTPSP